MKNLLASKFGFDDIVFENRNHSYGAFAIRKNYDRNMSKAFVLAVLFFVLAFLVPGIIKSFNQTNDLSGIPEEFKVNEVFVSPNIEKVFVQPRAESPANRIEKTVQNAELPPRVVDDLVKPMPESKPNNTDNGLSPNNNLNPNAGINDPMPNASGSGVGILTDNSGNNNTSEEAMLVPDEFPLFGNDQSMLSKYLAKNINYPSIAKENHIEGKVVVAFIIDKNGDVKSLNLLRGIGGGCNEEVFRVINKMPKWKAGIHHGKPVNVKMVLPVSFKLN